MDTLRYIRNPAEFLPSVSRACAVQTVSFVGMIIQRDVLQKHLHSIHDELFLYFDDLYFGYQLTLDGEAIRYSPEVIFTHDVSIGEMYCSRMEGLLSLSKSYFGEENFSASCHF